MKRDEQACCRNTAVTRSEILQLARLLSQNGRDFSAKKIGVAQRLRLSSYDASIMSIYVE